MVESNHIASLSELVKTAQHYLQTYAVSQRSVAKNSKQAGYQRSTMFG